jgi:DNA mismatch endonuclease (patch repair protein)
MIVRRLTHALGYRYRLHSRKMPGQPDLVFPGRKKVIFVHGCFWHRHDETCPLTRWPKSRLDFWVPKLEQNKQRDLRNQQNLSELGWTFLVVWECQIKDREALAQRIIQFLEGL